MRRAIPWILAAFFLVGFVALFSELQRMRVRFGEITRHPLYHEHIEVRRFIVRSELADLDGPIVILGDSITEMARFPLTIDGKPVVNAGLGGASIKRIHSLQLLDGFKPSIVVVALGANDTGSQVQKAYASLLSEIKAISPLVIAVAVSPMNGAELVNDQLRTAAKAQGVMFIEPVYPEGVTLDDGIHLNKDGYKIWLPAIEKAISTKFE